MEDTTGRHEELHKEMEKKASSVQSLMGVLSDSEALGAIPTEILTAMFVDAVKEVMADRII